jgi:hypothetical protein
MKKSQTTPSGSDFPFLAEIPVRTSVPSSIAATELPSATTAEVNRRLTNKSPGKKKRRNKRNQKRFRGRRKKNGWSRAEFYWYSLLKVQVRDLAVALDTSPAALIPILIAEALQTRADNA